MVPFFLQWRATKERLIKYLSIQNKILDSQEFQESSSLYEDLKFQNKSNIIPEKECFVRDFDPYAINRIELFIYIFDIEILVFHFIIR